MALDPTLLDLLRCPQSQQPLREMSPKELAALKDAIEGGRWETKGGQPLPGELTGALVRVDEARIYPIVEGVPDFIESDVLVKSVS